MASFTKHEKCILLFLVFTALLGTVLLFCKKTGLHPAAQPGSPPPETKAATVININTATAGELTALKGIGPATAERIVAYRREHGYFTRSEDIMKVNGIGPKKFEAIKGLITAE